MSVSSRRDPYLGYRFLVEIDSLIVAGFSEVTGLEMEMEMEEYQEGGVNTHSHKLPKRTGYANLTLRRGLTDSQALWRWIQDAVNGKVERRSGRIFLLDSNGRPSWGWGFRDAYPVKWTGPEFRADQSSVAVESLDLAHNGISKVR